MSATHTFSPASGVLPTPRTEWRHGWTIVLTCLLGHFVVSAQTMTLGIVMKPLAADFGWTRSEVSLALTFCALATVILAPFAGELVDRYGAKWIALAGSLLSTLGMILISLSGPAISSWYTAWIFYATVSVAIGPVIFTNVICKAFNKSRGMALGVALSGAGIGTFVWPSIIVLLFDRFGWRGVYVSIACVNMATVLPAIIFFLPSRSKVIRLEQLLKTGSSVGMSLKEALKTSLFWRICFLNTVIGAAIASTAVHLVPLLTDRGLTREAAVSIVSLLGPAVILGRLATGVLLDRVHVRPIAIFFLLLPAIGCMWLANYTGDYVSGAVAAISVGLVSGFEGDMLGVLISRYFGMRRFGAIYGLSFTTFAVGYAWAPPAAGLLFEQAGSYNAGLIGLSIALFLAAGIATTLGPYSKFEKRQSGEEQNDSREEMFVAEAR